MNRQDQLDAQDGIAEAVNDAESDGSDFEENLQDATDYSASVMDTCVLPYDYELDDIDEWEVALEGTNNFGPRYR